MTNESSTSPQKRLPDSWVRKIFDEMHGHYGSRFLNMWKMNQYLPDGQDIGIVNAMNHWAEKLGGFVEHPEAIKYALTKLPDEPPTLPQFLGICRHAPPKNVVKLEHKLTDEQIEANKKRIREITEMLGKGK